MRYNKAQKARIGRNVRRLRASQGMSQRELAKAVGLPDRVRVSVMERGKETGGGFIKLCNWFGVTPESMATTELPEVKGLNAAGKLIVRNGEPVSYKRPYTRRTTSTVRTAHHNGTTTTGPLQKIVLVGAGVRHIEVDKLWTLISGTPDVRISFE